MVVAVVVTFTVVCADVVVVFGLVVEVDEGLDVCVDVAVDAVVEEEHDASSIAATIRMMETNQMNLFFNLFLLFYCPPGYSSFGLLYLHTGYYLLCPGEILIAIASYFFRIAPDFLIALSNKTQFNMCVTSTNLFSKSYSN